MSTLTDAQRDWTQLFVGFDVSADTPGANGSANGSANGAANGASAPGASAAPDDAAPGFSFGRKKDPGPDHKLTEQETTDADADKTFQKALKSKKWATAAQSLNFFSEGARKDHLAKLPANVITKLHEAAVAESPNSPAAQDTDTAKSDNDMDAGLQKAVKAKKWAEAAQDLNFFSDAGLRQRLAKLPPETLAELHKAAAKDNPSSPAALATESLTHPVLGSQQTGRAAELEKKLKPEDQKKYQDLLKNTKSASEKQYITKGLAANHSVAELEAFAKKIKGKDAKWIQDNLSLTGDSTGSGAKQQWHCSCGPTTFEAVLGELDPIYALKMHEDNPDLTKAEDSDGNKMNKGMADDQKKMLAGAGSVAQNRDKGGSGMWITDNLNKVAATTGLKYQNKKIGEKDGLSLEDGIKALNEATSKGRPVPIAIGDGAATKYGHYVLVTASDAGPPRYYKIHDPWSGKTVNRSEDQIRKGNIDIAGWNKLGAIEQPSEAKAK